jgi:hypothetical protein
VAITFDGLTRRITLSAGTTVLSVPDLWSRYVDWLVEGDNSKWGAAMLQVGGDIAAIPIYVFLNDADGWAIVPQSADHALEVTDGVLYTVTPGVDPFVDPDGAYKIRINRQTPGIAIGYAEYGVSPADVWTQPNRTLTSPPALTAGQFLALKDA